MSKYSRIFKCTETIETLLTIGFEERQIQYWRKFDCGMFTSRKYGEFHFTGTFPTLLPLRYYQPFLTIEELNSKVVKTMELIKRCSQNSTLGFALLKTIESLLAGVIIPSLKSINLDEAWEFHLYALYALSISFDDEIELSQAFSDNPSALKKYYELYKEVLRSDDKTASLKEHEKDCPYPAMTPILKAIQQVESEVKHVYRNPERGPRETLGMTVGCLLGTAIIQKSGYNMPIPMYKDLRGVEAGGSVYLECIAKLQGIYISPDIRGNILFQLALRYFCGVTAAANDICGLYRDIFDEDGGTCTNLILHRVVKDSLSLNDSFRLRVREAQEETFSFILAAKSLLELYSDSEELNAFLLLMGMGLDESYCEYEIAERYKDQIKFEVIAGDPDDILKSWQ